MCLSHPVCGCHAIVFLNSRSNLSVARTGPEYCCHILLHSCLPTLYSWIDRWCTRSDEGATSLLTGYKHMFGTIMELTADAILRYPSIAAWFYFKSCIVLTLWCCNCRLCSSYKPRVVFSSRESHYLPEAILPDEKFEMTVNVRLDVASSRLDNNIDCSWCAVFTW